jgi:anti-anti-sigma regulatory factor
MTTPSAKLLVFVSEDLACIKIVGRANFTSSIDFKTLINELTLKGFTCFVLDLSECLLMDSTFLGVLAGFGLKMTVQQKGEANGQSIELLNPNPRIAELLENLGVAHLFKVVNGPTPMDGEVSAHTPVAATEHSRQEVTETCLRAHELLMTISAANISKFKDVTQFLADDLKKLKVGP